MRQWLSDARSEWATAAFVLGAFASGWASRPLAWWECAALSVLWLGAGLALAARVGQLKRLNGSLSEMYLRELRAHNIFLKEMKRRGPR